MARSPSARQLPCAAIAVTLALALGACGSGPKKPDTELAMSDAALRSAETAGARQYAPIELRTAREKKEMADRKMADEQYRAARRLSDEATVAAELAEARAAAEKSRLALKEVQDSIQLMRLEIDRASGR